MDHTPTERETLTIDEVAKLLGICRSSVYETVRRDGAIAGVPVIRIGKRLLIARRLLYQALGIE